MDYLGQKDMKEPVLEELIVDEEVVVVAVELTRGKKDAVAEKDSKRKGIAIEGVKAAAEDAVQSKDAAMDQETSIQNSFVDTFYNDFDVSLAELFEADDLFFSKVNAMKSDFAYLYDILPNGYS